MKYFGHVYHKSGSPMEGIRVSDGKNVAVTDQSGAYSLPGWEKETLIFCCALTNEHEDWYQPITVEKNEYDFYLDPAEDQKKYTFLHLSDTEVEKSNCQSFLPWIKKQVDDNSAAFVMHGGDLALESGMLRHREEMHYKTVGCPVRYGIGNHDFWEGPYAEKRYEELFGPIWYSFDLGEIHYIILPYPQSAWGLTTRYGLNDLYEWLQNDVTAKNDGKPLVIFRHDGCTEGKNFRVETEKGTYDLRKMGLIAWIQGHSHTNYVIEKDGVLHMCSSRPDSGGIDNTPGSIRRVKVDGTNLNTDITYNLLPATETARVKWLVQLDGCIEYASLIENKSDLFCATGNDGFPRKCGIYCINSENGSIKWFFQTDNSIKGDIAFDGDRIFAQDCEGSVYCLNATSGNLIWKYSLDTENKRFLRGSIHVSDEIVYAGNGRKPLFLCAKDGAIIFEGKMERTGDDVPSKTILSADGKSVFYNAQWLRLVSLDAKSGETRWDLRSQKAVIGNPGAFWYRTNTPLYHNGKIYAFGFSHGAIADAVTGEILLHKKISFNTEVVGSAIIHDGILYLPTGRQGVVALDPKTLEELWQYPVEGAKIFSSSYVVGPAKTVESSPQILGDEVVFAANDGYVYFYDKKKPELKKKIPLTCPTLTSPIVKEDYLFAASFDGTVGKYLL